MKRFGALSSGVLLFAALLGVFAQEGAEEGPLPQGPHVDLVYAKCQICHNLKYVTDSRGMPPFLWEDTVDLMVQLGMQVTDEEKEKLLEYLTTYMGPNPPPGGAGDSSERGAAEAETAASASERESSAQDLDGEALYTSTCSGCHQQSGQGVPGAFPPLVGHAPGLYGAEGGRDYLANLLLYGLQGEISVNGESYTGVMPAWTQRSDAELAAILDHVLTAWGNEALLPEGFTPYTAQDFADRRDQGLSAQDVLARRPALGDE